MKSKNLPKVIVEHDAEDATHSASLRFKQIVCQATEKNGFCNIALAGGTTPHALYLQLAKLCDSAEFPWSKVNIFFGDERDVPQDHVESNYLMAQKTLLDNVPIAPSQVYPMPADRPDLSSAAAEYEQIIRKVVPAGKEGLPCFDLILLGMGGDGHTASLFPGTDALKEKKKLVTAYFVPVLGRHRMTFTFPLINAAQNILLLVTGEDKAPAIAKLLHQDDQTDIPAAMLNPQGSFLLVLDSTAARWAELSEQ
jgi:6-phosphogluconolactonase